MYFHICKFVFGLWILSSQQQCQQISFIITIVLTLALLNYLFYKVVKDTLVLMDMNCFERMHPRPQPWKCQECNVTSMSQKRIHSLKKKIIDLINIIMHIAS